MQLDDLSLFLFTPANRLDWLEKATATDADAVIVDLEDAVAIDQKETARSNLAEALDAAAARKPIILRINATGTEWHARDTMAAAALPVVAVMLPKAESAAQCKEVARRCGKPLIALLETGRGVHDALAIARSAARLAFGNLDFAADLGLEQDRLALAHARSCLVLSSRVAGIASPIDGVTQEFDDLEVVEDDARHSRAMGFFRQAADPPQADRPGETRFAAQRGRDRMGRAHSRGSGWRNRRPDRRRADGRRPRSQARPADRDSFPAEVGNQRSAPQTALERGFAGSAPRPAALSQTTTLTDKLIRYGIQAATISNCSASDGSRL